MPPTVSSSQPELTPQVRNELPLSVAPAREKTPPPAPARPQLLFVVGLYRSGTSLLYALLNQHPKIALMYEADIVTLRGSRVTAHFSSHWLRRAEFWNQALSRHHLEFTPMLEHEVHDPASLYAAFAARKGGVRFAGEKSPSYCAILPRLAALYPEARFIAIRRNFADVYRSVLAAATDSLFFAQAGLFSRLVREQERLIQDARLLEAQGHQVCWVDYSELVERTEPTARRLCAQLGLEFDEHMVSLTGADLSAVYQARHHEKLRTGVIIHQPSDRPPLPARLQGLVDRLQVRWDRLSKPCEPGDPSSDAPPPEPRPEPSTTERWRLQMLGAFFAWLHLAKRAFYQIAPLWMLDIYRILKGDPALPASLVGAGLARRQHPLFSFVISLLILLIVALFDYFTGEHITLAPLYLLAPVLCAYAVNGRAAMAVAFIAAVAWSLVQFERQDLVVAFYWNVAMRFLLLGSFVFILARHPRLNPPRRR